MGVFVRSLNEKGIQGFRDYLREIRDGAMPQPPAELLSNSVYSSGMDGDIEVDDIIFKDKHEMSRYFNGRFYMLSHSEIDKNVGLWSWLALYYFDQLCPPNNAGKRSPGQDYRYILETGFRYYHRHLLLGPYNIYLIHGDRAPLLLSGPINKTSSYYVELSSRQG
ncbi:MAG: hypothetical protein JW944_09115, partial [Deltaproteobacteria bacterium]|nr:hypothetical protein [Deltaproteobacteria bacterium]